MNKIEAYMRAYLYELENELNSNTHIFDNVHFQMDEANTDKEVKLAIKNFILSNCLSIKYVHKVIYEEQSFNIDVNAFKISNVLTPDEFSSDDKENIKKAKCNSVFVNPDLIIKAIIEETIHDEYIELKSTKENRIPGSSVQQIVPNEYVIFIKHNNGNIEITSGQYKNSISGTMQFPDRSPRPQVAYSILKDWTKHYRVFQTGVLEFKKDTLEEDKEELLTDWQTVLAKRWLNIVLSNKKEKGEPWFNNNIRKYTLYLIDYYSKLSEEQKTLFLEKVKSNITDFDPLDINLEEYDLED